MGKQNKIGLIAVTGATGFIGSHLIPLLEANLLQTISFQGDLNDLKTVRDFFSTNKPKVLIHLVGSFSLPFSNLLEKNVLLSQRVLEESIASGVKHVIYISSGAVYGNLANANESDATNPVTLYGLSKLFGEEVVKYHAPKITYTILRFPNVYSKNGGKGVISLFLKNIYEKNQIVLEGDGSQKRQFLHVLDACRAIMLSLHESKSNVYNIAHEKEYSLNEIISLLQNIHAFSVKKTVSQNAQTTLSMNMRKAKEELEFSAQTDLEEFLKS